MSHLAANSGCHLCNRWVSGKVEVSSFIHSCVSFQVKAALDIVSERLSAFTDVGNSRSHVEHILKDLANFKEKSDVRNLQISISTMTMHVQRGMGLGC